MWERSAKTIWQREQMHIKWKVKEDEEDRDHGGRPALTETWKVKCGGRLENNSNRQKELETVDRGRSERKARKQKDDGNRDPSHSWRHGRREDNYNKMQTTDLFEGPRLPKTCH